MKPQKDWTEALRDRLKDAQVTPPADGWERLAEPHPIPPLKGRDPSSPSFWKGKGKTALWLAAAAAVLAVVLIINPFGTAQKEGLENQDNLANLEILYNIDNPENLEKLDNVGSLENIVISTTQETSARWGRKGNSVSETMMPAAGSSSNTMLAVVSTVGNSNNTMSVEVNEMDGEDESLKAEVDEKVGLETVQKAAADEGDGLAVVQKTQINEGKYALVELEEALHGLLAGDVDVRRVTFGIRNGGSSGSTTTIRPGALAVTDGSYYYSYRPAAAPSLRANSLTNNPYATIGNYVFKHNPELSLGLMAAYEPIDRLIFESGLTWSVLSSQVITPTNTREQRIQYLGLPIYVGWRFIEHGPFSLTASVGATIEHLLSARLGSWKQEERPWQFSVGTQMGVCYDLGHHFGLAFEPSVNYHLTETRLTTSRTDHPCSLAFRLTLHYTL